METSATNSTTIGTRHVDVRLLGSVRAVFDDGAAINLGGPMPRLVLVELALRAGDVVSTETLVDTLWGDDPPPTARRSLQAHVAKLRAAMGAGDGPLRSSGRGYILDVPRGAVDVLRIEDRVRVARDAMATDRLRAAEFVTLCRDDWAGPPLDDLAGHNTVAAHRERLFRLRDELDDIEAELRVARGDSATSVPQLERAVVDDPAHEPHWVRLITAYYASGRQRDALDAYRRASQALLDELGVDPSPQLQRLELQILRQEAPTADPRETCPYKGLVSYQIADGESFFGRSDSIEQIVNLVQTTPVGFLVGPSGVGKSSVLRAGLAHRILTGQLPGLLTVAVMTPGLQPLRALYGAPQPVDVLVVDQFEELFTLIDDVRRREEFVDELLALAGPNGTRIVISVRADFYGHCLSLERIARILGRHQVNIGALSTPGLRDAIEGPARAVGLTIEPKLLDTLVDEVSGEPGALPLLSHALSETWRRRSGSTLTLDAYRAAGSIAGAISATAERLHDGLDEAGRVQLESLFLRLVEPGSGTGHTRRAATRSELAGAGFDADLVDRLVTARLLTASTDQVEIAHEALIGAWPRLTEWIDDERDNIAIQQRLTRSAEAWLVSDRDDADLFRGNKLAATLAWQSTTSPALAPIEEEFLAAGDELAHDELDRQRRANQRLRLLVTLSVVAMLAALSATYVAVGRSRDADRRREQVEINQLASVVADDQALSQTQRLHLAAALQGAVSTPETRSLLLDSILRSPDVTSVSDIDIIAITGDAPMSGAGHALLVADENARPAVVDAASLDLDRQFLDGTLLLVRRVGPDQLLGVRRGSLDVIDLDTARPTGPPPELSGEPESAALSQNGFVLAVGYDRSDEAPAHIDLINVREGTLLHRIELAEATTVRHLEFDSARIPTTTFDSATEESETIVELDASALRLLMTVDLATLELWDVADGQRVLRTNFDPGLTESITTSAFDPTGDAFALGRRDGTVEVWREADGFWRLAATSRLHRDSISWVEFDAAGEHLVSSAVDGSALVTDAFDGSTVVGPVQFGTSGELASYFDVVSSDVITIDSDGTTWRWTSQVGGGLVESIAASTLTQMRAGTSGWYAISDGAVVSVAADRVVPTDAPRNAIDVITGRSDHVVVYADRLEWRRDAELIARIPVSGSELLGRVAVSAGTIAFFDAEHDAIIVLDEQGTVLDQIDIRPTRGAIGRLDLNPSATGLVYSTNSGELVWYSLDSFDAAELLPVQEGHSGRFIDDRRVVAVGASGVLVVDVDSREATTAVVLGRGAIEVAFDEPRGIAATLATTGETSLWDLTTGQQIGPSFATLTDATPRWIGFDADGRLLIGGNESTRALTTDANDWRLHACTIVRASDPARVLPDGQRFEELEPCA